MIAVFDCHVDPEDHGAPRLLGQLRRVAPDAEFQVYSIREGHTPEKDRPRAVVVSGSKTSCFDTEEWIQQLEDLLRTYHANQTPVLGICFGHQLLARALFGISCLSLSKTPETGWVPIQSIGNSPLWKGLPNSFEVPANHREEVSKTPRTMQILASSTACINQAYQIEKLPLFGVQFHPEKTQDRPHQEQPCLQILKNFLNLAGS